MTIERKTKKVISETTYICDMLFKEVSKEKMYKIWNGRHCICKEAVSRLPEDATKNKTILKYILYGSGPKDAGFQPEWLHKGWWALEIPTSSHNFVSILTNNNNPGAYHDKQFRTDNDIARFQTYNDVITWIKDRCHQYGEAGFRYCIFNDGKLIISFKTKSIPVETYIEEDD